MKFAEIYQYDFAGRFRDASTTGQTLVAWKSALPSLNTKQAALTDVETALCQYWRSVLELGAIYSIDSLPSNAGSTGACTTRDVLDAFTHRVANHSAVAQTSRLFFDVMHLRPAGRVQAQSSGRGADTADIIVRVYDSVPASQISATPVIRAARAHTSNISLRDWCLSVNVKAILSSLLRWEFTDSISIVAIIPQSDSLRPARGPALRDDALCTTQNILNIAINAASCYGDWFPRHALEVGSVDLSAIDRLIQEGVVLRRISDDFGDEECMLEWSRLEFRLSHKLGQPELVREFAREVDDINSCAKVEALGILLRLGWVDGGSAPQPVRPDSRPPKFCLAALSKGQLYWIALLRHELLFSIAALLRFLMVLPTISTSVDECAMAAALIRNLPHSKTTFAAPINLVVVAKACTLPDAPQSQRVWERYELDMVRPAVRAACALSGAHAGRARARSRGHPQAEP